MLTAGQAASKLKAIRFDRYYGEWDGARMGMTPEQKGKRQARELARAWREIVANVEG